MTKSDSPYRCLFGIHSILPLILMPTLPLLLYVQMRNERKRKRSSR